MPIEGGCQNMTIYGDGQLERLLDELYADEDNADDVLVLELPGLIPTILYVCCDYSYAGYS